MRKHFWVYGLQIDSSPQKVEGRERKRAWKRRQARRRNRIERERKLCIIVFARAPWQGFDLDHSCVQGKNSSKKYFRGDVFKLLFNLGRVFAPSIRALKSSLKLGETRHLNSRKGDAISIRVIVKI